MGRRILAHDWAQTPLGGPEMWPTVLRVAIEIALVSRVPTFVGWGPDHILVYNDAYAGILGDRHPAALGRAAADVWPEFSDELAAVFREVRAARSTFEEDSPRLLARHGTAERAYFTHMHIPLFEAPGLVGGVLCTCQETTARVLAGEAEARRQATERLAQSTIDALPQHIAVIDGEGVILSVNRAWRDFAETHGAHADRVSEGANYLAICETAAASGDPAAGEVAQMIRGALSGRLAAADLTYDCHTPEEERWFRVTVSAIGQAGPARLVIAHEDVTERRRAEQRIEYLATHDALTGLPNRNLLDDRARQAIAHARRSGLGVALLILDIDNFKDINDAYGHAVGDEVLRGVARGLQSLLRATDTVARLGGDEFVVMLTDVHDPARAAAKVARAIIDWLGVAMPMDDRDLILTASIGVSLYPADGATLGDLLKSADTAMYSAKDAGRRTTRFYSADLGQRATERVKLESDLREALREGQFRLVYQPQVHILSGAVTGAEALIRWRHPARGEVRPQHFIPFAEESGAILAIGTFVLRTACREARLWASSGRVPVAVNISAVQLRHPDFVDIVADILAETSLDPRLLELEITEGMVMGDDEMTPSRFEALKALGLTLTIDDFGTGYSNLGYLRRFPIDRLKIDRSFVQGLPSDRNAASIVGAIIGMSRGLRMRLIAEGVETAEQAAFLINAGCEHAQGYYFSRPLPPEELRALLA